MSETDLTEASPAPIGSQAISAVDRIVRRALDKNPAPARGTGARLRLLEVLMSKNYSPLALSISAATAEAFSLVQNKEDNPPPG